MEYTILDPDKLVEGQEEDVSVILANLQAIREVLNGALEADNFDPSFLAGIVSPETTDREIRSGEAVTVPGGNTSGVLTWDNHAFGSNLLNVSTLDAPTVVASGRYAITVNIESNLPTGESFRATLTMDDGVENARAETASSVADVDQAKATLSLTWYLDAGSVIDLTVVNFGVGSADFLIGKAMIQKL